MNALKSLVCAGVVGTGALLGAPQDADAGGFSISVGRGGYYGGGFGYGGGGYGYGGHRGFVGRGVGQWDYYPRYSHTHRVWHDTSHVHHYPGRYVWHGDHGHYLPGQTIYHRDGHWDYYGH